MAISYANIQVTKVLTLRGNTIQNNRYTGLPGELTVDTEAKTIRIHDGVTPGGNVIQGAGGASSYANANVKVYLTAFDGNIIPSANAVYSLGTVTNQWKSLFVSNSTIYVGGVPLSIDTTGNLTVNGNTIPTLAYVNTAVANVTVDLSSYALNANVTAANVGMKGYVDGQISDLSLTYATTTSIIEANVGLKGYVDQANTIQSAQITAANVGMKGYVDNINTTLSANSYQQQAQIGNLQASAYSNSNVSAFLVSHTDQTFGGNVVIQGNLFVNGNVSYISVNNFVVSDNIINLADNNPDDSLDLGFSAHRTVDGVLQHTGLIRDASANQWRLFSNVVPQPGTTVDFTNAIYDDLVLGNITSPTINAIIVEIDAGNVGMQGYVDQANSIQTELILQSNIGIIGYIDQANIIQSNQLTQANLGMKGYVDNAVSTIVIPVTYSNINVKAYTETMGFANYSNVNVAAYLTTNNYLTSATANLANYAWASNVTGGGSNYSNINVAAYLATATITTTGNITAQYLTGNINITGNVVGTLPNVTIQAGAYSSTFDNQGNVVVPQLFTAGNIQTAGYIFGNGAFLTGIVASGGASSYGNTEVITFLNDVAQLRIGKLDPTYSYVNLGNDDLTLNACTAVAITTTLGSISLTSGSGNVYVSAGNITTPGIKTNNYYYANGAAVSFGSTYSNVQVATYLPTYSGNIANIRLGPSGALTFADGTTLASASAIGGSNYSNANVASYLITNQYINANSAYSNANVTSYLPTHSGNVGVNNIIGTTPNVTLQANSYSTTYDIYGNVAFGNVAYPVQIFVTGNVSAANVSTGSVSAGSISTGNVAAGNVFVPGTSGKIGYSSGGFVQQTTSNTTGISTSTTSGNIQLMSINLGAFALHTVALSCNKLTTNDMLVVKHVSGGVLSVLVDAYVASDGLAIIWLRDVTGNGTGAITPMLKYAIIQAPSA